MLNTPNSYKRRRLNIVVRHGLPEPVVQGEAVETAVLELPSSSQDFYVTLHMSQHVEEGTAATEVTNPVPSVIPGQPKSPKKPKNPKPYKP